MKISKNRKTNSLNQKPIKMVYQKSVVSPKGIKGVIRIEVTPTCEIQVSKVCSSITANNGESLGAIGQFNATHSNLNSYIRRQETTFLEWLDTRDAASYKFIKQEKDTFALKGYYANESL